MLSKILVVSCVFFIPIALCQRPGKSPKVIPLGDTIATNGHDITGSSNSGTYQSGGNGYDGYSPNNGGVTMRYLGQSCTSREQCSSDACMDGKCCYHEGKIQYYGQYYFISFPMT